MRACVPLSLKAGFVKAARYTPDMRSIAFILVSGLFALLASVHAVAGDGGGQPRAVVELFTSQGCSSCPPAEALLGELSKRQDVITLAFHVDYWDGLGWRDPFSLPIATKRQRDYGTALRLPSVGTPHMVIDGRRSVLGANRSAVLQVLREPRSAGLAVDASIADGQLVVRTPVKTIRDVCDVYVVAYLSKAVTQVRRGENAGRTLTEVNIVRSIQHLGTLSKDAGEWKVPLRSLPNDADRALVMLQLRGNGPVASAVAVNLR
jgi:hypothetical protein